MPVIQPWRQEIRSSLFYRKKSGLSCLEIERMPDKISRITTPLFGISFNSGVKKEFFPDSFDYCQGNMQVAN
ncbi:hypothetical protein DXD09_11120 [Ligilactobacillus ruminis]|uniref:Uncharacterized protein n=1 Tax=Ligilactobacillus ruminis TaxID=1623 RepID=A0A8B2Z1Q8_9LACO|nr:hypothetical protein DXD09_11120 [Ligilactobacillus ruminis]